MIEFNPRITCQSGFSISVQAHSGAYSRREGGKLLTVECGFPSTTPKTKELREFAELCGTESYTETVYPYVPVEIVQAELEAQGGILEGVMPS